MRTKQGFLTVTGLILSLCLMFVFMSGAGSSEVSRDVLENAIERYAKACQSGEETALQQAMSSFAYASLKNEMASMGEPLTPEVIPRLAGLFTDMSDWSFVKVLHEGPTAALLYSPSVENADKQGDADQVEPGLIFLKFVNEDGEWKYEGGTMIGDESDIPSSRFPIDGKIHPAPPLLPVAEIVGMWQVKSYGYRTEVSINNVAQKVIEDSSFGSIISGGLQAGDNRIEIVFKKLDENTSRTPTLEVLKQNKDRSMENVFTFAPEEKIEGSHTFTFVVDK